MKQIGSKAVKNQIESGSKSDRVSTKIAGAAVLGGGDLAGCKYLEFRCLRYSKYGQIKDTSWNKYHMKDPSESPKAGKGVRLLRERG